MAEKIWSEVFDFLDGESGRMEHYAVLGTPDRTAFRVYDGEDWSSAYEMGVVNLAPAPMAGTRELWLWTCFSTVDYGERRRNTIGSGTAVSVEEAVRQMREMWEKAWTASD